MRCPVRDQWITFTEKFEGGVASFYNDVRGLTTIAYGNLCNTPSAAVALPMVHSLSKMPATFAEITAAWETVHNDPKCSGLGWRYAATLTDMRLPQEGMTALALSKLDENEAILAKRCATWAMMPACAQMAMHSLAWACGAGCHFPRLFAALDVHDYEAAAIEIHMNEYTPEGIHNAGLVPRNVANKILMRNAARVESYHLDPDYLNWTSMLVQDDIRTDPEMHIDPVYDEPENAGSRATVYPKPGSEPKF